MELLVDLAPIMQFETWRKPHPWHACLKTFRAERYLKEHAVILEHPTAFHCHLCVKVLKQSML